MNNESNNDQKNTQYNINDDDVIQYLTDHTDFFIRHPNQLESLKVSSKNGSVASLVNHQVNVLTHRNKLLKTKLDELINFAEENERIMSQVFELSLQLCQISHVANITKHFSRFVNKSFDCDMFKMVLPQYENLESNKSVVCVTDENAFHRVFNDFLNANKPISGRLQKNKLEFVFAKHASKIGSCVMLPIGDNAKKGILVFASFEENRFNTEISTDLLEKLTHILERKFKNSFDFQLDEQAQ